MIGSAPGLVRRLTYTWETRARTRVLGKLADPFARLGNKKADAWLGEKVSPVKNAVQQKTLIAK
jgi:hypothetical protein